MRFRARRVPLDLAGARVRPIGFWAGWVGLVVTALVALTVVALLIGWIFAFATGDGGNAWLLTLGPVAFSAVIAVLAVLYFRLRGAERLRQAENAFLTGASHNLRTPLSAIRAAAQTLTDEGLEAEDRTMLLDAVLHETNRLELRIDTLLETARIDFEKRPYLLERIDLEALLQEILRDARWSFAIRDGRVELEVDAEARPCEIAGDRRAIRILFENLIDNAIKSAHAQLEVRLDITIRAGVVAVRVKDAGIGFSPDEVELLFSGRRRGDTRRRGTGLGLPLSRAIARGHGGDLSLRSDGPERGAVAEVLLPRAEPSGAATQ